LKNPPPIRLICTQNNASNKGSASRPECSKSGKTVTAGRQRATACQGTARQARQTSPRCLPPPGQELKYCHEELSLRYAVLLLEQNARFLNRAFALIFCFYRNFCPKTVFYFSEIALTIKQLEADPSSAPTKYFQEVNLPHRAGDQGNAPV